MERLDKIYEGKAKILYKTSEPEFLIQYFKDDATAFNALKRGTILGKGPINNKISSHLFKLLEEHGIETHFVEQLSEREMLVKRLTIIPLEVVVRNIAAGSLAKRLGVEEGTVLSEPVLELYYKKDELGDPMLNDYHVAALSLAASFELALLRRVAFKVNDILYSYLDQRGIRLIDFKLEFGRHGSRVLLGDEITPDGCRFWDKTTDEKLDKDRFRRDLGRVEEAYQEVCRRICS